MKKGPGTLWGPPPKISLLRTLRIPFGEPWLSGAFSWIHEISPGSHGNPEKTQGPGWTICPFPSKPESFAPPLESSEKSTLLANANRRDSRVQTGKLFCRRKDMLGKLHRYKKNCCLKRILKQRSPVLNGIRWARKSENCGGGPHKVHGPFVMRFSKLNQHS